MTTDELMGNLEDAIHRMRLWRIEFEERVKKIRETEQREHRDRVAEAALTALEAGYSKAAIGRAMKTKNAKTVNDAIELGKRNRERAEW